MVVSRTLVFIAAGITLCCSHPIKETPKDKEMPAEVRFGGPKDQQLVLDCGAASTEAKNIELSLHKNDQPHDLKTNSATQRENSLVFQTPKPSDKGIYQCLCYDKFTLGVVASKPISVKKTSITTKKTSITSKKSPLMTHKPIEGRPYKLDCPTPRGSTEPEVIWMREKQGSQPERARSHRITKGPDNNLYFSNVTQEDVYKYSCIAQYPILSHPRLAEHVIEAVVADKEVNKGDFVPQYLTKESITAKAGDFTIIYCIYGSSPLAYPDWTYEGENVNNQPGDRISRCDRTGGKRLLIKDTYLSDQGTYTCTVDNGVGKPQSHSVHLTVVGASKLTAKKVQDEDIAIPCPVQGCIGAEFSS